MRVGDRARKYDQAAVRLAPCIAAKSGHSRPLWVIRVEGGKSCRLVLSAVPQKRT
jgi:hypothetical protein